MNPSRPPRCHASERAVAIVLVLAFIVLLTGLTVAFFSSSLLYRQISNSSANEAKVDLFAQGAVDTLVGDLKQEIAAGSNATLYTDANGGVVGQAYQPFNPNTAVPAPALTGQSGLTAFAPNLLKRSAYTQNFFPAGTDTGSANYNTGNTSESIPVTSSPSAMPPAAPAHAPSNRAANVSTTVASLNGRLVSPARWNKGLLVQKASYTTNGATDANDTDFTPDPSVFVPPDWVLAARDGSNPTGAFNPNMTASTMGASSIIGRYAYTVYDEGGLLDANVAGCPGGKNTFGVADPKYAPYVAAKNALAFADLTQLPGMSGLTSTRQPVVLNSLVGWRNYATVQPNSGTLTAANFNFTSPDSPLLRFGTAMQTNTNGFLRTSNTALFNNQSDRKFSSRQELIRLLLNAIAQQVQGTAAQTERANLQNSLQYLSTFSRELNQPSYTPPLFSDPNAPTILQNGTLADSNGLYYGGNNAFGGDKIINPSFLEKRVTAAFTRNDGSAAVVGEPLVLRRFALSRLSWVTYRGPSALNLGDPAVQATITAMGGNPSNPADPVYLFVQQGTPANVYRYFGLTWDGANHYWVYDHNSLTPLSAPPVPKQAGSVATNISPLGNITGREPDYFELLKAAINVGSLGKHGSLPRSTGIADGSPTSAGTLIQYRRDLLVDMQILQIGANTIDQFDADDYPTQLLVWNPLSSSTPPTRLIAGVENLPYLYRARCGNVRLQEPSTAGPMSDTDNKDVSITGAVALMIFPEIWNPYDANSTVVGTSSGISSVANFRVLLNSIDPDHYGSEAVTSMDQDAAHTLPDAYSVLTAPILSPPRAIADTNPDGTKRTPIMTFSIPAGNTTLFREPTVLMATTQPGSPSCTMEASDQLTPYASGGGLLSSVAAGGAIPGGGTYLACGLTNTKGPFAGLMIGRAPLAYYDSKANPPYTYQVYALVGTVPSTGHSSLTVRLQYQDAWGNFQTYCEKAPPLLDSTATSRLLAGDDNTIEDGFDPRSARFGMMQNRFTGRPEWVFSNPGSGDYRTLTDRSFTDSNTTAFLNRDFGRGLPQTSDGGGLAVSPASGWSGDPQGWGDGDTSPLYIASLVQNDPKVAPKGVASANVMYADPDGVVRRAMGGFIPQTWPSIPASATTTNTTGNPLVTGNNQSRPMILNRPFRNVAELGYVYRDTPWKNLDFFSPESADAALLDVFCINDTDSLLVLQAGKVNLNTRQEPVVKAILAGAYKDEESALGVSGAATALSAAEAANLATYAFTPWRNSTMAPAKNLAGFISQWGTKTMAANYTDYTASSHMPAGKKYGIDGGASYSGFARELTANTFTAKPAQQVFTTQPDASWNIQRLREAPTRALTAVGQTRTWNLMIDLIAQTGRYPGTASSLNSFVVEGEQRYWVHLAIDRYTGQVFDKQIEVVKE